MPAVTGIRVEGLKELQAAFRVADKALSKELPAGLKRAGEPVRVDAERLAVSEILNIGFRWSRMRVGVRPGVVYVAPRQRGIKSRAQAKYRRPKLARKLMNEAMIPALEANKTVVEKIVSEVLDEAAKEWANG